MQRLPVVNNVDNKPKMVIRNKNDVTITWQHTFDDNNDDDFILQILDYLKEWKTIYWGKKKEFKVKNLSPYTCYSLRIRLKSSPEWVYFKAATEDDGPYCTSMHISRAIKMGNTSIIRKIAHLRSYLLEVENKENKTPLIQAIEKNDIVIVNLLITLGANVNIPLFYNKRTPLMLSVYSGYLDIASLLIEKGANKYARDINGLNILHFAVDSNLTEAVSFCLEVTEDVDPKDQNGWTPFIRAAITNSSGSIKQLLMAKGANPDYEDKLGFNFYKYLKIWETFN